MNKQEAIKRNEQLHSLIEHHNKTILELRAQVEEMEKIIDAPEKEMLWRPRDNEDGIFISMKNGKLFPIMLSVPYPDDIDMGGIFRTISEAEKAVPLVRLCLMQIRACLQADPEAGGWIGNSREWSVSYSNMESGWIPSSWQNLTLGACFVHTEQQAERAAAILNAEGITP